MLEEQRRDIDGLRAAAVVPIVLAHAGVGGLPGGFVGVDVFFVISGFLITGIIAADLADGRLSLAAFYRRRVVRILPALLVLIGAVLLASRLLMFPAETVKLSESAIAVAGLVPNIYFWIETDYFSPLAETTPLLHTWSLGAEEQFYLLYPLLMALAWKKLAGRLVPLLLAVVGASAAFGAVAGWLWPQAGFYLLPGRAWELGLGGLVALGAAPPVASPRFRALLALSGAALLAAGYTLIEPARLFPFPLALLPCLGCALLLAYGRGAPTAAILAAAPVRAIGLVSYSLYLWHWPILAFYRFETGMRLETLEIAALVAASLVAAALSYRLVERPFRARYRNAAPRGVLLAGAAATAAALALAAAAFNLPGSWRTVSPEAARIAAHADYWDWPQFYYQFRRGPCFRGSKDYVDFDPARCLPLADTRRNVVILGDSHAAQYWRAFHERHPDLNVIQGTASGCRPLVNAIGAERCLEMLRYVHGPLLASGKLDVVVLAARWQEADLPQIAPTIAMWRGRGVRVVMLGPAVEYHGSFPAMLARSRSHGDTELLRAHRDLSRSALDRRLAAAARRAGARYVSVAGIVCPQDRCRLYAPDGGPMHFDYGHLTLAGSRWVVARIPLPRP